MSSANPTLAVIRAQIRAIGDKAKNANVFGIYSRGRWTGPSIQNTGDEQIAVYQCDSPLQMRLALQNVPPSVSSTVLITPLDQSQISDDILVRMARRRLFPIDNWEIVRSLFKAKHLDPRITRHTFLAQMLLEFAGNQEIKPVAGGFLDAETVWGILLSDRLGLEGSHPDVQELLRNTAEANLASRWKACSREFRDAALAWISEAAGDVARTILGCIESEHGANALSIGLTMGIVYHDKVGHELDKAAGRLEAYVGSTNLQPSIAQRWRDASAMAAMQLSPNVFRHSLEEAEVIIENIGARDHVWHSDMLESGFDQRLSRFGLALATQVDSRATSLSEELVNVYKNLQQHRMGRDNNRRMQRVTMAIRLAHWLADQNIDKSAKTTSLLSLAQDYASTGGFVDWARRVLRGGESNKDLAAAYVRLVDRVTDLREIANQHFGDSIAEHHAAGDITSGLIPVEQILDQVVVKTATKAPVLLLVLDGMSWAVFRELVSDITSHNWIELGFAPAPRRMIGLSALPSVTQVCRTSLLCGTLKSGQAYDETQGFATHPALSTLSQPGYAPKLFHKAALEGDEDSSLASDIRQALSDKKQQVVGVVINAVDDHLDKGDQIDAVWTMQHIRVLEPILSEAAEASRLVVLLSDHGHILDRQTHGLDAQDGLRWRRPNGSPINQGEIEISSPRAVLEGGRIIVPWSEKLRYGPKKNGYHGGATPQEMLIPISILWPELQVPEDLVELPVDLPMWWIEPTVSRSGVTVVKQSLPSAKEIAQPPTLFDEPKAVPSSATLLEPWITALLQSDVYAIQKKLVGRVRIDETILQRLLTTLDSRRGSITTPALASAIEVPEHRLPGLLAVMQRLLNVEGYAILDRQDAANTVVLNIPLLKKQFELE
ncbi:MAG TPA: BREX-2 system phosphatase PglZ [Phycisphaerales bacterium]|nr:BREX-2 system phosphatase PglZ [Phycisphaerales bacterium]|tara:strand:- start:35484 stop:38150 length:2667 start_codon:yes stop_codon:yes gene_type:complete